MVITTMVIPGKNNATKAIEGDIDDIEGDKGD
jgi:hypothetical protein